MVTRIPGMMPVLVRTGLPGILLGTVVSRYCLYQSEFTIPRFRVVDCILTFD